MVIVGAFPIFKLGLLAFKQISKPLSKVIKERAKAHPLFRRYVCMPPAQLYHWMDVNIRMRLLGLGKAKDVTRLSEDIAVDLGSEMLGESIIFSVAASALYFEYKRSSEKEARKEAEQESDIAELQHEVTDLQLTVAEQSVQLKELQRYMESVKTKNTKRHVVIVNNFRVHHDEALWTEPWQFKPERFLDDQGHLLPPDHDRRRNMVVFSLGKRRCIGEMFARARVFQFVTHLCQRFHIYNDCMENLPSMDPHDYLPYFAHIPKPFNIKLYIRQ